MIPTRTTRATKWGIIPQLFLFILLLSFSVIADPQTDYRVTSVGSSNGIFTTQIDTNQFAATIDALNLQNSIIPTVWYDIDEDGLEEAIAVDNTNIRIYRPNTTGQKWTLENSFDMTERPINKIEVLSLNGTPAIYTVTNDDWRVIYYNGSSFTNFTLTHNFARTDGGFGCASDLVSTGQDWCLYYSTDNTGAAAQLLMYAVNITNLSAMTGSTTVVDTTGCTAGEIYTTNTRPELRDVALGDSDNDGLTEAYITWGAPCTGGGLGNRVYIAKIDHDFTVTNKAIAETGITCQAEQTSGAPDLPFTAPLLYDIDQSAGNGLEVIVACITDGTNSDDYKVGSWSQGLVIQDDYPEVGNVESTILSNPFVLDCFTDTGATDVGILGYDEDENETDLLCISELTGIGDSTREFDSFTVNDASVNNTIVYSASQGEAQSNIFTPYGVWRVATTNSLLFSEGTLSSLFSHSRGGITQPVSYNNNPIDLMVTTATNLWYIDDQFENTNPSISIEVDPCNPIKTNESVVVLITVSDADNDNVRTKIISYQGTSFEQDSGYTSFSASGTTFTRTFTANNSISNANLRVVAEDNDNESVGNTTLDYTFTVNSGVNAHSLGECTGDQSTIAAITTSEQAANDAFEDGINKALVDDLGLTGTTSQKLFAVLVIIIIAIGAMGTVAQATSSTLAIVGGGLLGGVGTAYIFFTLNMIGVFFFILVTLICVTMMTLAIFGGMGRGGD